MDLSLFDWTIYWFMFPIAICVATTAMLSGIGGAAIFAPIFMIVFPMLGPEYPLESIAAAIGVALLTEVFGFSSGFVGYYRKKLIDFRSAVPFIIVGVPIGVFGAIMLGILSQFEEVLRGSYGLLMLILSYVIIKHHKPQSNRIRTKSAPFRQDDAVRVIKSKDGNRYEFPIPRQGKGAFATGLGGFLTGLLGVGIGEVVMPQLVKHNQVPIPVAAATSVFIVIIVVASASFTQITTLVAEGGLNAVPWNIVVYTVPAVILGGQIGPRLQGKISQRTMEKAIGYLFFVIGVSMAWIAIRNTFVVGS
ncbi:MAG: sulfite exporter TauE/SafE family protein [Pseudomonadota bacterium]|nr:sulfite exporter TauE/SafE family protein [Pseudomonadota bacterium]